MQKKNVKEYTTRVHGNNINLMERHETSGQPKLSFGKRPAKGHDNEQNKIIPKKITLVADLNNSINGRKNIWLKTLRKN